MAYPTPLFRLVKFSRGVFVWLLSLRDLRDGVEPNKYCAWWLGLHRIVIAIFLFPHFSINDVWSLHRCSIFYLYGGARLRGGPAPPPRASIQAMARILIEGRNAIGNLQRQAPSFFF